MTLAGSYAASFVDVEPQDLPGMRDRICVIDVRECAEFEGELGRVPGAHLVPLAELPTWAEHWPKHEPVLLVCRSGRRSSEGAASLVQSGFTRVFNLRGGMQAYRTAGLPVEHGPCPC